MLDHESRALLGWVFGGRDTETGQRIMEGRYEKIERIYADHYASYPEIAGMIPLKTGKENTVQIERNNGYQRHWLACFHRRTMVVSRNIDMLEARMKLFARYRINGSIHELIAKLRIPATKIHPLSILK